MARTRAGIEGLFKKAKVDYVKGKGKITSPNTVQVTDMEGKDAGTLKVRAWRAAVSLERCGRGG